MACQEIVDLTDCGDRYWMEGKSVYTIKAGV